MGPKEKALRESYASRPHAMLDRIKAAEGGDPHGTPEVVFRALFRGTMNECRVYDDGKSIFTGKAESEWGWPHSWEALRDAGLIAFRIEERGPLKRLIWEVTDLGWAVRDDYLAYGKELSEAREADRPLKEER